MRKPVVKPPCLREGDIIGIISPSSPVAAVCKRRFERGVGALESLGFGVKMGGNAQAKTGHTAGTIDQRLKDIHEMFLDREVKLIMASIGGYNFLRLT